jgi:trk system potassium uptake protein TrkH
MDYKDDPLINITIMITVILGGLGFIVLTELIRTKKRKENIFKRFTLHSKIVLFTTFILIVSGAVIILILEWSHSIKGDPLNVKLLVSFFQSVTCRTAGFNTVDISGLRESTLTVMMLLMFIGGAPGSMAGGIKVTTFAVITGIILSKFKGKKEIVFWHRGIGEEIIHKSTTLVILAFTVIYISTIILLSLHSFDLHNSFLSVIFEIISAFSTVGLSTGITPSIPEDGKILISLVMFTGRIGIYAIITAITAGIKPALYKTAEENIMIG